MNWSDIGYHGWTDLDKVRAVLAAGADPDADNGWPGPALHQAAERGSPEVVAELARRVADVDALHDVATALWRAVAARQPDNARILAAAGADPLRDMMSGWSPARLSLTGPTPDLFGATTSLTDDEAETVRESHRLIALFDDLDYEGLGLACVAGIDAAEAVRRINATVVEPESTDDLSIMWATDVPGGCVIAQPWGYAPTGSELTVPLSAGTTCYDLYANPKSGDQGDIVRDGEIIGSDLHPGGGVDPDDENPLLSYLYEDAPVAYCFAFAGLRPTDTRAVTGPPDLWIRVPA
ncbi:ankyrin repeat domain-containing protein [Kutzneria sp. 744]|uniref:ankyrin repeat domain-containing protein n=1 Tax=Kutzneria sp. (strain 744) TaxID=345341 RepID=UPI0003EEDF9E|nr:ankyrin repeat domain-containing protein [Kutzneria sp. 744]EWM17915.1 hypothetical protein KUTG_08219 [Kutzneria sp. 744]